MSKLKRFTAVFFVAVMVVVSGAESTLADTFFSQLFQKGKSTGASGKSDLIVVLDAGHGGSDAGAVGNRLYEKVLNLKIAQYCKAELEKYQGVKVYMTRESDRYLSLEQRVANASAVKADVFVSLHINSAAVASANGAEVYYPNSNYRPSISTQGKKLAGAIQKNLTALGLRNRGLKTANSVIGTSYPDGSTADYYAVIRGAKKAGFPGIIVEHGFISNASDAKTYLNSSAKLKRLGVADAKGIAACYGLKKSDDTSVSLKPTNLTKLVGNSSQSVSLKWSKVKGAGGYEIYRSASKKGNYKKIATVKKAGTTSYKDKSVKSGKTYYYKIRPFKMTGSKKVTAAFCAAQKVKLLNKPVVKVKKQSSRVNISWKQMKGANGYEIYRSTSKNGTYQKVAFVENMTSYQDVSVNINKSYYYKVRAVGSGIKGSTYSSYSIVQ